MNKGSSQGEMASKYNQWVEDNTKRGGTVVTQGGMHFKVHADVFAPNITELLMEMTPSFYPENGRLLEIGSGCGLLAIHAVKCGGVKSAMATDIVAACKANIEENARDHGVADKVEAVISDVFSDVSDENTFDAIFWNYPFIPDHSGREYDELGDIERGIRDPGQQHLKTYCSQARKHLKPGGKLYVSYSQTMGDWPAFSAIMKETEWNPTLFADFSAKGPQVQLWCLEDQLPALLNSVTL